MCRYLIVVVVAALSATIGWAGNQPPSVDKDKPLPYPAKAHVVFSINGYDRIRDRLSHLLTTALPDDAVNIHRSVNNQIERFLEGRKLTALRKDARIYVVFHDLESVFEGTPSLAVLVPVTSHQEFLDSFLTDLERRTLDTAGDGVGAIKSGQFGEEMSLFLVDLKQYIAIALDRHTAEGYAGKYTGATTEMLGSDLAETFLKADLALLINLEQINQQFGEQIRAFRGLTEFALQQAAQEGILPGFGKQQVDAIKKLLQGAFQGLEDCQAAVLGVELHREGIQVRLQARFMENSPSAKWVSSESSKRVTELGKLPAGLGHYTQWRLGKEASDLFRTLSLEFVTTVDDERGAKLIEEHVKDHGEAGPQGEWSATATPGIGIAVSEYTDATKAHRAITKAYKAVAAGGQVRSVVVKTAPRVLDDAVKHRGFTFSEIRLNYDFEATVASLPDGVREQTLEMLKRTLRDKTDLWIGSDEKQVITLNALDWESAQSLLDQYLDQKSTVAAVKGFQLTRSQLPEEAAVLYMAETHAAITSLVDSLRSMGEMIPGLPRLGSVKPIKGPQSFLGLAITLKGEIVSVTAFVPNGALSGGRKVIEELFKVID
jgi:hypothetical protein